MGARNNAYDEMDINEETKKKFYDNCINLMENMDSEQLEKRDENNDVQTVESSELIRKKKDKKSRMVSAAVAVFAVGTIAAMMAMGIKYINGIDKKSAGKENTTEVDETKNIDDYGSYYSSYVVDDVEISSMYSYVNNGEGNNDYNKDIAKLCYDKNGKLKEGYEEKEFNLSSGDKKITLVGKDFVVLTRDEARKNADIVTDRYLSNLDDNNLDKTKPICEKYANEFCSSDYVYYIQGEYLVRTRLDKEGTTVCDSSMKHLGLSKVGNQIVVHGEYYLDPNSENGIDENLAGLKVFDYYKNIGKEKTDSEEYGYYNFYDMNTIITESIKLFNKKNKKLVERIDPYVYTYSVQDGIIVLYYIDTNHDLWRISNVSAFDDKSAKVVCDKMTYDSLLSSEGMYRIEIATGVYSNYKAEKIAKQVDVSFDVWPSIQYDKVEPFEKLEGFEELIVDENVTYMDHEDFERYMSETN